MKDQQRNLDPHAAARAAMALWNQEYAAQRGGSMDFWDSLTSQQKKLAARIANDIRNARPYTGNPKSHPKWRVTQARGV